MLPYREALFVNKITSYKKKKIPSISKDGTRQTRWAIANELLWQCDIRTPELHLK